MMLKGEINKKLKINFVKKFIESILYLEEQKS